MDEFYGGNVFGYSIEPTSDKGLHRYIDFYSMLPEHIRNRPDLMKVIYLFQDYLNDGYRKIPEPTITNTYKTKFEDKCGPSTETTSYYEIRRPFNHVPSMYKKLLSDPLNYSNIGLDPLEEYDKERDLDTWAIDFDRMDSYKSLNSEILFGQLDSAEIYSYYNEPKLYHSTLDFYSKLDNLSTNNPTITTAFQGVYLYISTKNQTTSPLDEESMSLADLKSLIPTNADLPKLEFEYFACDANSFLSDFHAFVGNTQVLFKVQQRKTPYFYGISDYTNYSQVPPFSTSGTSLENGTTFDNLNIDSTYNDSFRVSFGFNSVKSYAEIESLLNLINSSAIGTFAFNVFPSTLSHVALFTSTDYPCIASSLLTIIKYQHPEIFYNEFSSQNEYRHEPKNASVAEKIYRMAYSKDPNVFDYEYLRIVAQHFGYSIETDEEEINQNSYYKTKQEKELVLRKLISNMPEYNRMKGTDSGIEMVLLSFGLIGRIVTLFTIGDDKVEGYKSFIDGRLISGDINEYAEATNQTYDPLNVNQEATLSKEMSDQFRTHPLLSGTSIYDWYASPHFRVEFDILKDFLNISRNSDHFATIAKSIRRIKPINTVFQGFYAKLSMEYGPLFINPPIYTNKVKQILFTETGCEFSDDWTAQCALELIHDS